MDTLKHRSWHRFMMACWDRKAAAAAKLMGEDEEDTPDVWLPVTIDLNEVIAVNHCYDDEKGCWLHLSNGERMRVDKSFEICNAMICQK